MGTLALAAKITHVPSMYLSELDGPCKGTRQDAIDGHKEIGRRWPHIDSKMAADAIVAFSERGCRVEFERLTSYVLGEAAFPAPVAALAVAAP